MVAAGARVAWLQQSFGIHSMQPQPSSHSSGSWAGWPSQAQQGLVGDQPREVTELWHAAQATPKRAPKQPASGSKQPASGTKQPASGSKARRKAAEDSDEGSAGAAGRQAGRPAAAVGGVCLGFAHNPLPMQPPAAAPGPTA